MSVVRLGAGLSLSDSDPIRATGMAPGNARAIVADAQARIESGTPIESGAIQSNVVDALGRDSTITTAIEQRALFFEQKGNHARAQRLLELSDRISRRSLPTRLWLIQQAVDRGDVEGSLRNFDIALRTSMTAPEILFPVLAGATTDPGLVGPIARLLDRPSDWRLAFIAYAISEAGSATSMADVLLRMRDRGAVEKAGMIELLIGQLVKETDYRRAREVQDAVGGKRASSSLVRDSGFADPGVRYPFGWALIENAERGASRDIVGDSAAMTYWAGPSAEGQIASQLLLLRPGSYLLTSTTAAAGDPNALPFWTVTCDGARTRQIALMNQPAASGGSATVEFTVGADCTAQWLALNLRGSDAPDGQNGAIRSVMVRPR